MGERDPTYEQILADHQAEGRRKNAEIERLRAELASRQIDIDTFREGNQKLRAELAEAKARIAELEGASEDTPFEAVHACIREGVLRATEEIRQRDDVRAAHEIMASACQLAANRLNSELSKMAELRARAECAEAERDAVRVLLRPMLDFICAHGDREDEGDQDLVNRISAALAPSPAGPDRYVEDDVERLFEARWLANAERQREEIDKSEVEFFETLRASPAGREG